jgi:hypothetical protein
MLKILILALALTVSKAAAMYTAAELEQTRARSAAIIVDVLQ